MSCKDCLNLKVLSKSSPLYKSVKEDDIIVFCKKNILSYHVYVPDYYGNIAKECSFFDDMTKEY